MNARIIYHHENNALVIDAVAIRESLKDYAEDLAKGKVSKITLPIHHAKAFVNGPQHHQLKVIEAMKNR